MDLNKIQKIKITFKTDETTSLAASSAAGTRKIIFAGEEQKEAEEPRIIRREIKVAARKITPTEKEYFEETPLDGNKMIEQLENVYVTRRLEMVSEDWISTPLAAVRAMADDFEAEVDIQSYTFYTPESREISWRIEMSIGILTGLGEAPVRKLACHMAAIDILEQIKVSGKTTKLPVYGMMPGCLVSPQIYQDCFTACGAGKLGDLKYYMEQDEERAFADGPKVKIFCKIGECTTFGSSDSYLLAKRLATLEMYETVTESSYPLYRVHYGKGCIKDEVMQAMNIKPLKEFVTEDLMNELREKRKERRKKKSSDTAEEHSHNETPGENMANADKEFQAVISAKMNGLLLNGL